MHTTGRRTVGWVLAVGIAAGRLAVGVGALAAPGVPLAFWVDDEDVGRPAARLLARALGGRDVALAAGALAAAACRLPLRPWTLAGAAADGVDALATAMAWRHLPPRRRRLVLGLAGGAALTSAVAAVLQGGGFGPQGEGCGPPGTARGGAGRSGRGAG